MRHPFSKRAGFSAIVLTGILATACSDSSSLTSGRSNGQVRFVLGGPTVQAAGVGTSPFKNLPDSEGRTIESATISLSSLLARNLDGQLIGVTIDLPVDVDLVQLLQGHTYELPMGSLPAGSYDQLVVVIKALHVGLSDGTQIDVTPPGGGWTAIVPAEPFDVVDGQVTTVSLHFRPDASFRWDDGRLVFDPSFDCDVDHHHGDDDDDD